MIITNVKAVRV